MSMSTNLTQNQQAVLITPCLLPLSQCLRLCDVASLRPSHRHLTGRLAYHKRTRWHNLSGNLSDLTTLEVGITSLVLRPESTRILQVVVPRISERPLLG